LSEYSFLSVNSRHNISRNRSQSSSLTLFFQLRGLFPLSSVVLVFSFHILSPAALHCKSKFNCEKSIVDDLLTLQNPHSKQSTRVHLGLACVQPTSDQSCYSLLLDNL